MKRVAIIPNTFKDTNLLHTRTVYNMLHAYGIEVRMSDNLDRVCNEASYVGRDELLEGVDMLMVLGGDGTLLQVADECARRNVPILGLNLGHLGFLSELEKQDLTALGEIISGKYRIEERMMLQCDTCSQSITALNDIVVSRGDYSRLLHLKIYIDDSFMDSYLADGLIIATPTGSTAYSLSAGGPIIDPNTELISMTPICAHSLHARSIIVPANKRISIVLDGSHQSDAVLEYDGQRCCHVGTEDMIIIERSPKKVKLVRTLERSFFDTLRLKLGKDVM